MSKYRRYHDSDSGPSDSSFSVPFKDAHPDSQTELPLDELDNFIVPGRDEHGAHQTITINCPPVLVHQIDVIVRSQLFPYINRESFCRHSFVRQLRWLQSIRPESLAQHIAPTVEGILEKCFQSQMRKKVQAAFEALKETIVQCQADGEYMEVLRLCYYVKERLANVDPGSVWQKRAWKKFLQEFGHYMSEVDYITHKGVLAANGGIPKEVIDVEMDEVAIAQPTTAKRLRVRNEFDDLVN